MGKYNIERISQLIRIGWDGENNWRPQTFDCSSLLATRPNGTVTLWILPNGESEAFPVALTADGNLRTWTPLDSELVGGGGKLQFHCQSGTDVGKSPVYRYVVEDSLLTGAEHPDETPSWAVQVVEDVTEAAGHYPYIGENGNWFVWDYTEGDFVDTGVAAGGSGGSGTVTSVNNVEPDANGNVSLSANDVGAGTYSKPSGGIPASDLATGVIPDISGKQDAPLIGSVGDSTAADYVTPTQVYNALLAGKDVIINYSDMDFSGIHFTAWGAGLGAVAASIVSRFGSDVAVTLTGTISNNSWSLDSVALVDGDRLARVATTGSYDDLSGKPTIPTVPTNVSAFTNDAGYQTAAQVQSAISPLQPRSITDTGNYYTTDTVEGALQEIGGKLLPSGGSAGDFLRKTASGVAWETVPSAESNSFGGGST